MKIDNAVRINARKITMYKRRGKISYLFDCEGKEVWFPSENIKIEPDNKLLVERWLYERKIENGEL
jgi:hypothetical protein